MPCTKLLYRRVKLWSRRNAAAPLLALEKDGFAGRSIRSVSRVSHYFQLVFLLCWAPGKLGGAGGQAAPQHWQAKATAAPAPTLLVPG